MNNSSHSQELTIFPFGILAQFADIRSMKYCRHILDLLLASGKDNAKGASTELESETKRLAAVEVCILTPSSSGIHLFFRSKINFILKFSSMAIAWFACVEKFKVLFPH